MTFFAHCRVAAPAVAAVAAIAAISLAEPTQPPQQTQGEPTVKVQRFAENPIISPSMDKEIGKNINGPSLIRVPDWVENPLGKYYLYFAHHTGQFIRMAYADDLHGPWKIYAPGTLQLSETACGNHIASPDVLIDEENHQILMYFHGKTRDGQLSFLAKSKDGVHFTADKTPLGPSYFRVFKHEGWFYAILREEGKQGGAVLYRSKDGTTPFEQGPKLLPRHRHSAVLVQGDKLLIFFSRGNDEPERILLSTIEMKGDWNEWKASEPVTVMEPEEKYEGTDLPLTKSEFGQVKERVRQLRDPAVFQENGKTYLLYSVAGESGIGIAEISGF